MGEAADEEEVRVETVFARAAVNGRLTKWERLAFSRNVPNAEHP